MRADHRQGRGAALPLPFLQNTNSTGKRKTSLKNAQQRDIQRSLQDIRPISTPQLHTLLCFHLVPINQIISLGT